MVDKKIRVLISKSALDAHDRGPRYLIQLLRDAGMEVIFSRYAVVEEVIKQGIEEDVDVIGLSFYGAGLMHDCQRVVSLKKAKDMEDVLFIVGGTIMPDEKARLLEMGVNGVFEPNVGKPEDIVGFITSWNS